MSCGLRSNAFACTRSRRRLLAAAKFPYLRGAKQPLAGLWASLERMFGASLPNHLTLTHGSFEELLHLCKQRQTMASFQDSQAYHGIHIYIYISIHMYIYIYRGI